MRSIHATLLGFPEPVIEQLERTFGAEGFELECRRLPPDRSALPQVLPPGLVLLWDDEGPLQQAALLCGHLASLCALSLCRLFVVSSRDEAGQAQLLRAGASACLPSPREGWAGELLAHVRRLGVPSREGSLPRGEEGSRVPPEEALRTLLAATTAELGQDFFHTLVKQLAGAFRITCAIVGELSAERDSIRTLAFWSRGAPQDTMTYPLRGTPCYHAAVCSSSLCHVAEEASRRLPQNPMLTDLGQRGYLGTALRSARGEIIGVLAIMHDRPLETGELDISLLGAFAARAGAELERLRDTLEATTARKRLETQLRQADRMTSMGMLVAGVAHEINSPLSSVTANVTWLSEQLADTPVLPEALPELREVLAETQEGTRRIRSIVQDLKSFSRGDEEHLEPVDLRQVLEGAGRMVRGELQRHDVRLEWALEPVPRVWGNASRLGQVLVNLLVNAIQAFPERRPECNRIRVSLRPEAARQVVMAVEDNGKGMSPEVLERIFEPFFTTKPVGVGTGLGLAICHTLVTSMGGRIAVRSTPGRGTAFELILREAGEDEPTRAVGPAPLPEGSETSQRDGNAVE